MSERDLNTLDGELVRIALAGLLHDVGKPRRRTGEPLEDDRYDNVCPSYKGSHAAHTARFFDRVLSLKGKPKGVDFAQAYKYACNHHRELDRDAEPGERIVQLADRLAGGHDRDTHRKYSEEAAADFVEQQEDYIKFRLKNPFGRISLGGRPAADERTVLPLKSLAFDVLPVAGTKLTRAAAAREYADLWRAFEGAFGERIPAYEPTNNWLNGLATLMEEFFFAVPASSYGNLSDTSLYDHCRLTAAFACALHRYREERPDFDFEAIDDIAAFRLIQGDFSGIQQFIFDFRGKSRKGAAKILRARSFYVAAASEAAAAMVCAEFGLSHLSIVLNAGGKFTVLAPNLPDSGARLEAVGNRINKAFYVRSYGQTRFNLAGVEASGRDFHRGRDGFGKLLTRMAAELETRKLKPYVEEPVFKSYLGLFEGKEAHVCPSCSYRPVSDPNRPCAECRRFRDLGAALVKDENCYLLVGAREDLPGQNALEVCEGVALTVAPVSACADRAVRVVRWRIRDYGDAAAVAAGHRRLAAYVPVFKADPLADPRYDGIRPEDDEAPPTTGEIKSFEYIAADALNVTEDKKCRGTEFLGMLKADVDNLGEVFMRGEGEDGLDLSRTAGLSRQLDYFFTGWLPRRIREAYASTYTVFAGGDDLFLVGPWNHILDLAREIWERFDAYTGRNPSLSLSAGIAVAKPGVSLLRVGEAAEEALSASKERRRGKDVLKNAVTVFGQTVPWETFRELLNHGRELRALLDSEDVPQARVYQLLKFTDMREAMDGTKVPLHNTMWRALHRYSVVRNFPDRDEREKQLRDRMLGEGDLIEKHAGAFRVAVFKALYEVR